MSKIKVIVEKKLDEALKIDRMWVKQELMDFDKKKKNPDRKNFEELAKNIFKHYEVDVKKGNLLDMTDHLMMYWDENESFGRDFPVKELEQFLK